MYYNISAEIASALTKRKGIAMYTRIILVLGAVFLTGCPPSSVSSFITMDVPGSSATMILGIDGDRIVGCYWGDDSIPHGFLGSVEKKTFKTLDVPGTYSTMLSGINGKTIVGWCWNDAEDSNSHGCIYDMQAGIWTVLDAPQAKSTYLFGVDRSNIVGYYIGVAPDSIQHAFLYNVETEVWLSLDKPGDTTFPYGISSAMIAGSYEETGITHGCYRSIDDTWHTVDFPGACTTEFCGIRCGIQGDIITGWWSNSGNANAYGFLYNVASQEFIPCNMPDARTTYPSGLSGKTIVGYYQDDTYHGFVADSH